MGTLMLLFIMLHIYGVSTATESYFLPLSHQFLSLLWTALKLKYQNKDLFLLVFYSFSILLVKRTDRFIFGRQISNTRGGESVFFALTRCFWSDRAFIISALNKKIWFQKYFTENVLKPLLKQAYYLICASYIQRCDLWI